MPDMLTADELRAWADAYDNGDLPPPEGVNPALAPELLAALECLFYTIDGLMPKKSPVIQDALNIAHSAITKAKGV